MSASLPASLAVVSQFSSALAEPRTRAWWRAEPRLVSAFASLAGTAASPGEVLNCIGGCFVPARGGGTLDDVCPATGRVLALLPRSGAADVDAAVCAAEAGLAAWRRVPAAARADALDAIAEGLAAWAPELAALESADAGKTLRTAQSVDIPRAAANFKFFAGAVRHDEGVAVAGAATLDVATREPVGVVALISPWNLPLYLASWKVAPALACGNAAVLKPSELTPRTAAALAHIAAAVLPPGVLNVVHGLGGEAGAALVAHARVRAVSFTGGTATGRLVAAAAAPAFKKLSLELGGRNATVIFADVAGGVPAAVAAALRAAFTNNGQVCLAGSRVFVERALYADFAAAFVRAAAALAVGDPAAPGVDVGPLSCAAHADKVAGYIDLARAEGGTVECGGRGLPPGAPPHLAPACFVRPCVITGLPHTARAATEEIFGPVVTVHAFDTEEEAARAVNATKYGLAGSVWTADLARAHRMTRAIESGLLWVNCWMARDLRTPFGGVKDSGTGREGGRHSLEFYSEWKNVTTAF